MSKAVGASSVGGPSGQAAGLGSAKIASSPLVGLLCALAGGALSWFVLQCTYPVFEIPAELSMPRMFSTPEQTAAEKAATASVDFRHAVLFMVLFGALIGGAMGIGEGVSRKSCRGVVSGLTIAGLTAALMGILAGTLGHATRELLPSLANVPPHMKPICFHGVMFAVLGAGVGLGFGGLSGRIRVAMRCMLHGLLGGLLAGMLYPFLAVSLLPPTSIDAIIPYRWGPTSLWIGLAAVLFGLLITSAARKSASPRSSAEGVGVASASPKAAGPQATDVG